MDSTVDDWAQAGDRVTELLSVTVEARRWKFMKLMLSQNSSSMLCNEGKLCGIQNLWAFNTMGLKAVNTMDETTKFDCRIDGRIRILGLSLWARI
ncbi:hypothetical protein CEXT_503361 [Caerostris extrusa]|uniref:Uncharacterized protein n=1 Tax=Caerostris extrusa TaxID=172846 RepID=A0AAV4QIJ1_CAEEX|nr:hypothetical protein CEXT_503361 [Caerostris extrusa]